MTEDAAAAAFAELERVKEDSREKAAARDARRQAAYQHNDAVHQLVDAANLCVDGLETTRGRTRGGAGGRVSRLEDPVDSQQDQLGHLEDRVARQADRRFWALQDQIQQQQDANTNGATGGSGAGAGNEGASAAAVGGANPWFMFCIGGAIVGGVVHCMHSWWF